MGLNGPAWMCKLLSCSQKMMHLVVPTCKLHEIGGHRAGKEGGGLLVASRVEVIMIWTYLPKGFSELGGGGRDGRTRRDQKKPQTPNFYR